MSNDKLLSICIPSYKRPAKLRELLQSIERQKIADIADIIVTDDGPCEETKALAGEFGGTAKFIYHNSNEGYARTFIEFFSKCRTPYLMTTADDDTLSREAIEELLPFLKSTEPAFVSTVWNLRGGPGKNGCHYRGRRKAGEISLADVTAASTHAPGLVYNVGKASPLLEFIERNTELGRAAAFFYPQTLIVYILLLSGEKCFYHLSSPVNEGSAETSGLKDPAGNGYWSVPGRWRTSLSYIDIFRDLKSYALPPDGISRLDALVTKSELEAFRRVTSGVSGKALREYWMAGGFIYAVTHPIGLLRSLAAWARAKAAISRKLKSPVKRQ